MKRNIFPCLFIAIAASLVMVSCAKEDTASINPTPDMSPWSNGILAPTMKANAPSAQSFSINASDSISQVRTASGNIYTFTDSTFVNADGSKVQGTISLEITEILKKSDMFFNGISTLSNGELIASDNMAYIKATANGKELKLNKDSKYTIFFHTTTDSSSIYAFQGYSNTFGITAWSQKTYNGAMATQVIDSTKDSMFAFRLQSDSLHWVNCDHFINSNPAVNVTISLGDKTTYEEAAVALIFKKDKSCVLLSPNKKFNQWTITNMPSGKNATIVVLAKKNGSYYSAFQPFSITDQFTTVNLQSTGTSDFVSGLKALD
jgi:hypothetical protein